MKRIIYISAILFFAFLIVSCATSEKKEKDSEKHNASENDDIILTKAQFEGNNMKLDTMTTQPFPSIIKTSGMIDVPPENKVVISSFSAGYIKTTPLLIGDKVKKGQALVTIENPDFVQMQQDYMEVTAQLNYLKSEYDRQKTLIAEKITSQKNYLKSESEYKRALAMHNALRKKMQMLNINPTSVEAGNITSIITLYAPISGSVTKVNVNKGTYISPSDIILEIINTDHIHLELTVFEKDIMKIKEEQKIVFKIPESSNENFNADVHLVGTAIDEQNRTVKVHGHLKEDVSKFTTGMFVTAEIHTDNVTYQALPDDAIVSLDGKFYVLILIGNENNEYTFSKKELMVGESYNGFTAIKILDDFKNTDVFLTKGGHTLIKGESSGHQH